MQLNAKYAVVIIIFSTGTTHKVYIMARDVCAKDNSQVLFMHLSRPSRRVEDKSFNTTFL